MADQADGYCKKVITDPILVFISAIYNKKLYTTWFELIFYLVI